MSRTQLSQIYSEIRKNEIRMKGLEMEMEQLRNNTTILRDRSAAIRDARAGIYDTWYRDHRENNTPYDEAWNIEKMRMLAEGCKDGWQII